MRFLDFKIFFVFAFLFFNAKSQTLIMNEVSNGPTGNQEYVEFVVVSNGATYTCNSPNPPCIDIRGWIFDDNSGYHGTSGIAAGAVRFSQNPIWACIPLGTIILIYNNADRNPAIPADDLSMTDGNCTIIAPLNSTLFESNVTTPGAIACSYPTTGWTPGGNWNNTLLANGGDCARIVDLGGCEVFSLCWATANLNSLIYFNSGGSGSLNVWYFNGVNPSLQANWSEGTASPSPGNQTPGAPNNAANAAYISQFNNGCMPITPINVTASLINAGCTCNGSATATASGSIGGYTYVWYDSSFNPIGQTTPTATGLCVGVYNVIAKSSIGCSDTTSVTIVSTLSNSVAVNSQTICAGNFAILTATPSVTGGSFIWTPGGQTTASISVNPGLTTTYSVNYTLAGCGSTNTSVVTVNPLPTITVNSPTICYGETATLLANGATTYSWSNGTSLNSLTSAPIVNSTYTVTGTTLGCSNTAVANIFVTPLPIISVNSSTICSGKTATLMASGASAYLWNTGSISNSITPSPISNTNYTVIGTASGCSNTAVSSVVVNPVPTVTVNSPTMCLGQSVTLLASGATTYSWSTGAISNSIIVSPTSTNSFIVLGNSLGCTNTAIATINVIPLPNVTVNSPVICGGQTANLTANGASTYTWSTGLASNLLSVSPSSTTSYTVIGTTSGCTNIAVSNVSVTPLPNVTVNSPVICSGQTGTLNANGATTYTWSTGITSSSSIISPTSNTIYTVTGTTSGCTNTAVSNVSVTPLPIITVNSSTVCAGLTATLSANGANTYTWSTGSNNSSISDNPATTTTYSVLGELSGCVNFTTATIVISSNLSLSVNTPTICAGQTTTLTSTGATTYTWSNGSLGSSIVVSPSTTSTFSVVGANGTCSGSNTTTVLVNPLPLVTVNSETICSGQSTSLIANGAATYSWSTGSLSNSLLISPISTSSYTVTGATSGCTNTAVSNVSVTPLPIITVNSPVICEGQTATLTANGASTYIWSTGLTSSSISISPTITTSYTLTGSASGCTNTAVSNVSVTPLPTITVNSTSVCIGQPAALTANGASTFTWSTGSTSNPLSISTTSTTSYTVTGATFGCTNTAVSNVSVNPLPTITVNSATICAGQTATLVANGATSYTWSSGTIGSLIAVSPTSNSTFSVIGINATCSNTANATINVLTAPILTGSSSTICAGETATLTVSGAITYSWNNGSTTNTTVVSPISSTTYSVEGTNSICTSATTVNVVVNQLPIISVLSKTICAGESTTLTANGASTYSWNTNSLSNTLNVTPITTTIYTVTGISSGCSASQTVAITVNPVPNISFNSNKTNGCAPLCVQLSDLTTVTSGSITNWNWSVEDAFISNQQNPSYCFENAGSYDIKLTVTSSNGCSKTYSNPNMINVFANPVAEFTSDFNNTDILNPVIGFINLSTNATNYIWNFGDATSSTIKNPYHTYNQEGLFTTTLTAINQHGCKDVMIHDIIVKGIFTFYAPNTFTPNEDNVNDIFLPLGVGWNLDTYQMDIFDRWGNNCFNTNVADKGWDGKANDGSESAQIDTYTWKVDLTDVFGIKHKYIGKITLLR